MFFHRRFLISVCIFISAIIFCGVVEVVFTLNPAFICPTQCVCIVLIVFWTNSIRKRITEPYARRLLVACGILLAFYFSFEIIKYRIYDVNILWYFYYIPMAIVPLLSFFLAYEIYGKHIERRKIIYPLFALPSTIILALILTNDLHGLAFKITNIDSYTYGPVYIAHMLWSIILLAGILYFSIKGFHYSHNQKFGFILALPIMFQLVYTVLYVTGNDPAVFGVHLWSTGTIFAATSVGILEMCIQLGLIPSNSNYEKIYGLLKIPSGIFENSGACIYSSMNFNEIDSVDENYLITESKISGGYVKTAFDISTINKLNKKLLVTSKRLQKRNEYLTSKNRIEKEKTEIEERSKIYDEIALAVMPRLEKIKELLHEDFDKNIGEIAILNAYVKRRSNIELLSGRDDISSSELIDALQESSEYIKLLGADVVFVHNGEGVFSSQVIIEVYNWFEDILEGNLENLKALVINVKILEDGIQIRLMISAKDREDVIATLHLKKEGGRR